MLGLNRPNPDVCFCVASTLSYRSSQPLNRNFVTATWVIARSLVRYDMGQCIVDDGVMISSERVSAIIQIMLCYWQAGWGQHNVDSRLVTSIYLSWSPQIAYQTSLFIIITTATACQYRDIVCRWFLYYPLSLTCQWCPVYLVTANHPVWKEDQMGGDGVQGRPCLTNDRWHLLVSPRKSDRHKENF